MGNAVMGVMEKAVMSRRRRSGWNKPVLEDEFFRVRIRFVVAVVDDKQKWWMVHSVQTQRSSKGVRPDDGFGVYDRHLGCTTSHSSPPMRIKYASAPVV